MLCGRLCVYVSNNEIVEIQQNQDNNERALSDP